LQPRAVVAIDFGTARSGYAFTFNNPNDIHINEFEYQGTFLSFLIRGSSFLFLFLIF
jgi:hypothetical protein